MCKAFNPSQIPMQPPRQQILETGPLVLLTMSAFYERKPAALRERLVRDFTEEQLETLENTLEKAHRVLPSPYCLAESTNLIKKTVQRQVLAHIASSFVPCRENTKEILQHPRFPQLGVADVNLLLLSQRPDTYTLTADRELCDALSKSQCAVIYFCVEPGK